MMLLCYHSAWGPILWGDSEDENYNKSKKKKELDFNRVYNPFLI